MVSMKIICEVLLRYGRLVEDQASAAHEWMGWVLTKCEANQRRQEPRRRTSGWYGCLRNVKVTNEGKRRNVKVTNGDKGKQF
jgi:hypothetical protein